MQHSPAAGRPAQSVDILLFDRFSNHCLASTLEPLRAANTLSGKDLYRWRILSPAGDSVRSSSGLKILTDAPLVARDTASVHAGAAGANDHLLVLMSSYGYRQHDNRPLRAALARAARCGTTVVGLDTGAWLMAAAGLLGGRPATIHRDVLPHFAETFPAVRAVDERFVIDGRRITCGGAMAAFDLILHLIGQSHGELLRLDVASLFLQTPAALRERLGAVPAPPVHTHGAAPPRPVERATALMREHLSSALPISALAAQVNCSQRSLARYFSDGLGVSPSQLYRHLRLAAIRQQVENSDRCIADIAVDFGYESASAMTRAFRGAFGVTPVTLRRRRNRS